MKKTALVLALFTVIYSSLAQEKLITRTAKVSFLSETPIEKIEADNTQVASIFDISKNKIAFNALLKSFRFDKALMEEHFNEKYVHSDKFPAAKFKGTLDHKITLDTPKRYENIIIDGEMTFHGVTNPMKVKATLEVLKDKTVQMQTNFKIALSQYNIEVPSIVKEKIASDVAVTLIANYK